MADVAGNAVAQRSPLIVSKQPQSVVASLVMLDGQLHGLIAIESSVQNEVELQQQFLDLRWGSAGIESMLRRLQSLDEQKTRERLMATLDMVASVLAEEGFQAAAQALATDLAIRLDCDRVSLGFVRDHHTKVLAVSHSAEFGEKMNLIRAIGMAMDEAIDQRSIMRLPAAEDEE
jgi:hypothetical protein